MIGKALPSAPLLHQGHLMPRSLPSTLDLRSRTPGNNALRHTPSSFRLRRADVQTLQVSTIVGCTTFPLGHVYILSPFSPSRRFLTRPESSWPLVTPSFQWASMNLAGGAHRYVRFSRDHRTTTSISNIHSQDFVLSLFQPACIRKHRNIFHKGFHAPQFPKEGHSTPKGLCFLCIKGPFPCALGPR